MTSDFKNDLESLPLANPIYDLRQSDEVVMRVVRIQPFTVDNYCNVCPPILARTLTYKITAIYKNPRLMSQTSYACESCLHSRVEGAAKFVTNQ